MKSNLLSFQIYIEKNKNLSVTPEQSNEVGELVLKDSLVSTINLIFYISSIMILLLINER
jgi:hypothetical protein